MILTFVLNSFLNKYLVKDTTVAAPDDANKLRISPRVLGDLICHYEIPPAFLFALCRHYLPSSGGTRVSETSHNSYVSDHWYFLPVRVQVRCTDTKRNHTSSAAGNNQMDPFHYLHLPEAKVDIRGSTIAVFSRFYANSSASNFCVFNFMDGRWAKVAEEPQNRIKQTFEYAKQTSKSKYHSFPHLVYLTSVSRWWTNILHSVNLQIISYV